MPLHDYVIDNQTGLNFRVDLNLVLAAIVSLNSNATEPTTRYAYMLWVDTTAGILKQRNSSNTGWVDILDLTTGASVATAINDLTDATTAGTLNTGLGDDALSSNTTGIDNTAVGARALMLNTTGNYNTAVGMQALTKSISGVQNTALGMNALFDNTLGYNNTALGFNALFANTTGFTNTAVGESALSSNTTGNNNTGLGNDALKDNTTGTSNTAVGARALANTTSNFNTAVGASALDTNIIGVQNTAVGFNALFDNLGDENTAIGLQALFANTTGFRNIAIGNNAGNNITTEEYTITMGYNLQSLGSNYFTFGKNSGADRVYNQFTANATWTRASDKRIKKDIQTNEDCGLGFINALRTVTYKFKAPSELSPEMSEYDKDNDKPSHDKKMYGFIAQEVKEVLEKHNIKDFAGWHIDEKGKDKMQGISYEMFVMPLVKAVQELSVKNQELSDEIQEQNDTINLIMERIEALENLTK